MIKLNKDRYLSLLQTEKQLNRIRLLYEEHKETKVDSFKHYPMQQLQEILEESTT